MLAYHDEAVHNGGKAPVGQCVGLARLMFEHLAGLSLDTLRVFEAAARLRSFTAAALELGTTQPAISQQIKRLEAQLGTRLFDRIYRGIELTEAGRETLRLAMAASAEAERVFLTPVSPRTAQELLGALQAIVFQPDGRDS